MNFASSRMEEVRGMVNLNNENKNETGVFQASNKSQKREAKRLALIVAVMSVAVLSLTLNEKLHSDSRPQYVLAGSADKMNQLNRAIASAQPLNIIEDVQAEHDWVKKINEYDRRPSSIGERPSSADQFRYGQLAGKYRVSEKGNQVSEIEYIDSSDVSDRPIMVQSSHDFLIDNKEIFSVKFSKAEVDTKNPKDEVFRLFNESGQVVGRAAFQFDDSGHLISLKVQEQQ